jgi:hypothetical protein
MGAGETYQIKFAKWFRALDERTRTSFCATYPEPADWQEFYNMLLLPDGDAEAFRVWRERHQAKAQEFLESHYQAARASEEAGQLSEAIAHFQIVITRNYKFRDAWKRFKLLAPERCGDDDDEDDSD